MKKLGRRFVRRLPLRSVVSLTIGVVAWEVTGQLFFAGRPYLFVPFSAAVGRLVFLASTGSLIRHTLASLQWFAVGSGVAAGIGVPLGVLMGSSERVRSVADPWVTIWLVTPHIVLFPVVILWLGIGLVSKAMMVFLGALFPMVITTYSGSRMVSAEYLEVAASFGATRLQQLTTILIPGSVPSIIGALRLGLGRGLISVVVAEWLGTNVGLGLLIKDASDMLDSATVFAGALTFCCLGLLLHYSLSAIERRAAPWHQAQTEQ